MAPLVYRSRSDSSDQHSGPSQETDGKGERSIRGFKIVHVFDVTQTEGDELPELAKIGGEPGELARLSGRTDSCPTELFSSTKCCRAEPKASHEKARSGLPLDLDVSGTLCGAVS